MPLHVKLILYFLKLAKERVKANQSTVCIGTYYCNSNIKATARNLIKDAKGRSKSAICNKTL